MQSHSMKEQIVSRLRVSLKIDKNIAPCFYHIYLYYIEQKEIPAFKTLIRIPDDLWNEIKNILPDEKPRKNLKRSCLDYFGNYPLTSDGVKYWEVFR